MSALLEVKDLRVQFETQGALVDAVDGISYSVDRGRTLAIVGEAGSGKTAASLAILGLTLGTTGRISGRVLFEGRDLLALGPADLHAVRGNDIAIAFQDPLAALHPLYTVGAQVIETIVAHRQVSKAAARDRTIDLLELVGIPDSRHRVDQYPEQLSPEIRRRVTLAMALANEPKLLIVDEPAAGLDVTVQPQILQVLDQVRQRLEPATIITSRDPGLIQGIADEVQILTHGRLVERPAQSSSST